MMLRLHTLEAVRSCKICKRSCTACQRCETYHAELRKMSELYNMSELQNMSELHKLSELRCTTCQRCKHARAAQSIRAAQKVKAAQKYILPAASASIVHHSCSDTYHDWQLNICCSCSTEIRDTRLLPNIWHCCRQSTKKHVFITKVTQNDSTMPKLSTSCTCVHDGCASIVPVAFSCPHPPFLCSSMCYSSEGNNE